MFSCDSMPLCKQIHFRPANIGLINYYELFSKEIIFLFPKYHAQKIFNNSCLKKKKAALNAPLFEKISSQVTYKN